MRFTLSFAHVILARLLMIGLVIQFYLAGVGAFGASSWDMHETLGSLLALLALVLLVLALIGRLPARAIGTNAVLVVLFLVQFALVEIRDDAAYLAALHALNALAIMGSTASLVRGGRRSEAREPATRPSPSLIHTDIAPEGN